MGSCPFPSQPTTVPCRALIDARHVTTLLLATASTSTSDVSLPLLLARASTSTSDVSVLTGIYWMGLRRPYWGLRPHCLSSRTGLAMLLNGPTIACPSGESHRMGCRPNRLVVFFFRLRHRISTLSYCVQYMPRLEQGIPNCRNGTAISHILIRYHLVSHQS
jgi:hypothetical protein